MIAYILIVFMAAPSFSTNIAMQEFSTEASCRQAVYKVKETSSNVREAICVPK